MRKTVLIVGGLAVMLVLAVVALAWFALGKQESDKNKARTEPARIARAQKLEEQKTTAPNEKAEGNL